MADLEQLNDWELLHNSDSEPVLIDSSPTPTDAVVRVRVLEEDEIGRNRDVGFEEEVKTEVGFEGIGEIGSVEGVGGGGGDEIRVLGGDEIRVLGGNQDVGFGEEVEREVGFEGIGEIHGVEEDGGVGVVEKVESSGGGEVGDGEATERVESGGGEEDRVVEEEDCCEVREGEVVERVELSGGDEEDRREVGESEVVEWSGGDDGDNPREEAEENRGIVWWKVPLEILKFCVFRVNPVWSLSVAAAVLGLVILRKRLNRMKQRKSRNIPIKLAVEDKKASQLKMHATRLNEAFSVVRSVPVIRARLLPAGVTPWPTLNLR